MPLFEVELSDGRIVELESDSEPTERDVLSALGSMQPEDAAPTPAQIAPWMFNQEQPSLEPVSDFGVPASMQPRPLEFRPPQDTIGPRETGGIFDVVGRAWGGPTGETYEEREALAAQGIHVPLTPKSFFTRPPPNVIPRMPTVEEAPPGGLERAMAYIPGMGSPALSAAFGPDITAQASREAYNLAAGLPEFMISRMGVAALPVGAVAHRAVTGGFAADMLRSLFEQDANLQENWDSMSGPERTRALVGMGFTGALAGTLARTTLKAPPFRGERGVSYVPRPGETQTTLQPSTLGKTYARSYPTPATLYGNVRPLTQPAQVLPAAQGGPGVQPQTREVAEKASEKVSLDELTELQTARDIGMLSELDAARLEKIETELGVKGLSTEDARYIIQEREGMQGVEIGGRQVGIEVVETAENQPFAPSQKNSAFTINPETGNIVVIASQMRTYRSDMRRMGFSEAQINQAIKSSINEELLHLGTDPMIAGEYWQRLTPMEKLINRRRYGLGAEPENMTPELLGMEALRFRMQQAARMTPTEFTQMVRSERWTWQAITALERAVRFAREKFTRMGKEQRQLFDITLANLTSAKSAIVGASPAAPMRKIVEVEREDGTRYEAEFNGYYDMRPFGGKLVPSIGRGDVRAGETLSHGMLRPTEKVVTQIPSFEEWQKSVGEGPVSPSAPRTRGRIAERFAEALSEMRTRGLRGKSFTANERGHVVTYSNNRGWYVHRQPTARGEEVKLDRNQFFVPGTHQDASLIAEHFPDYNTFENAHIRRMTSEMLPEFGEKELPESAWRGMLPDVTQEVSGFIDKISGPQLTHDQRIKVRQLSNDLQQWTIRLNEAKGQLQLNPGPGVRKMIQDNIDFREKKVAAIQKQIDAIQSKAKPIGPSAQRRINFGPRMSFNEWRRKLSEITESIYTATGKDNEKVWERFEDHINDYPEYFQMIGKVSGQGYEGEPMIGPGVGPAAPRRLKRPLGREFAKGLIREMEKQLAIASLELEEARASGDSSRIKYAELGYEAAVDGSKTILARARMESASDEGGPRTGPGLGPAAPRRKGPMSRRGEEMAKLQAMRVAAAEGLAVPATEAGALRQSAYEEITPEKAFNQVLETLRSIPEIGEKDFRLKPVKEGGEVVGYGVSKRDKSNLFDEISGDLRVTFGAIPNSQVRELAMQGLNEYLDKASNAEVVKILRRMNLVKRVVGGGKPGERTLSRMVEAPTAPELPMQEFLSDLKSAVKRAKGAKAKELKYNLLLDEAKRAHQAIRESGWRDVDESGNLVEQSLRERVKQGAILEPSMMKDKVDRLLRARKALEDFVEKIIGEDVLEQKGYRKAGTVETAQGPVTLIEEYVQKLSEPAPARPMFEPTAPKPTGSKGQKGIARLVAKAKGVILSEFQKQAEETRKPVTRKEIEVDELADPRTAKEPVFFDVHTSELGNPTMLGQRLTEDARVFGKNINVEDSRRLVVLLNRESGRVEMVSIWDTGAKRAGVVVRHPGISEARTPLETVMKTHRPIHSILLDEPVRYFRKQFKSLSDFNREFGNDARAAATQQYEPMPIEGFEYGLTSGRGTTGHRAIPGEFVQAEGSIRPSASVVGPMASVVRTQMGVSPGEIGEGARLTDAEAGRTYDYIRAAVGKFDSPADFNSVIESLAADAAELRITQQSVQVVNALNKMFNSILESEKDMTPGLAMERMATELYEINRDSTREGFIRRVLGRYGGEVPGPGAEGQPVSPTARELTARTPGRIEGVGGGLASTMQRGTEVRRAAVEAAVPEQAEAIRQQAQGETYESAFDRVIKVTGKAAREAEAEAAKEVPRREKETTEQWLERVREHAARMEEYKAAQDQAVLIKEITPSAARRTGIPITKQLAELVVKPVSAGIRVGSEWMVDRLKRVVPEGATFTRRELDKASQIISDQQRYSGDMFNRFGDDMLRAAGRNNAATRWMNELQIVAPGKGAIANSVEAIEGRLQPPEYARELVGQSQEANLMVGQSMEPFSPGFISNGGMSRNLTTFGYDTIRDGRGPDFENLVEGSAIANNKPKAEIRKVFRRMKRVFDNPNSDPAAFFTVNQDFIRVMPRAITHLRTGGHWEPVIHAELFNYFNHGIRRAAMIRAFRERYPAERVRARPLTSRQVSQALESPAREAATEAMSAEQMASRVRSPDFRTVINKMRSELPSRWHPLVNSLYRTMQGHPSENLTQTGWISEAGLERTPSITQPAGVAMRILSPLGQTLKTAWLSQQVFLQPGELMSGASEIFFGYRKSALATIRHRELYPMLESIGAVDKIMYDNAWNPNSPIRGALRIFNNVGRRFTGQNLWNELQESQAAGAAYINAQRLMEAWHNPDFKLTWTERNLLPRTFRAMGFTPDQVSRMMRGDPKLLGQMVRKAASFASGGHMHPAEQSRLSANRAFQGMFWFQRYPMTRMNQFQKLVETTWEDAWAGDKKGARNGAILLAKFMAGAANQGLLQTAILTVVYGGTFALSLKMKEALDDKDAFLFDMFRSAVGGPFQLATRGWEDSGLHGVANNFKRIAAPVNIAGELYDVWMGKGAYNDMDLTTRIGKYLQKNVPLSKTVKFGVATFGLSQDDPKLDDSIKALNKWKRKKFGFESRESHWKLDEGKKFRIQMKKAVEALKDGDSEAHLNAIMEAAGVAREGKDPLQSIQDSFNARRVLTNPQTGADLTLEETEELINRIGEDAYDRLMALDMMLKYASGQGQD